MRSDFNYGVGDAQINPPDYGEARCEDCGSFDCDEIEWRGGYVWLCRECTLDRYFAAGELDEALERGDLA